LPFSTDGFVVASEAFAPEEVAGSVIESLMVE
jgi:hypothetical protein